MEVIKSATYNEPMKGFSAFGGERAEVIGEQTVLYEGKELEQYVYNIVGHEPKNGLPFVALKANIHLEVQ